MDKHTSSSNTPSGSLTEQEILNREIKLIYEALAADKEAKSKAGYHSECESEEDEDVKPERSLDVTEGGGEDEEDEDDRQEQDEQDTEAEEQESTVPAIVFKTQDGELAADPETCLALNRAYQEVLTDSIRRLHIVLTENRERQVILEGDIENDMKSNTSFKDTKGAKLFHKPYFQDRKGKIPPSNPDSLLKKLEYDPYEKHRRTWCTGDSDKLTKAIAADGLKRKLQPLMSRKEIEVEKLESATTDHAKEETQKRISALDKEIVKTKFLPDEELYGRANDPEHLEKIDWMKIATIDFDGDFSESYLRHAWCNTVHPIYSPTSWSPEEDHRLCELACINKHSNWPKIAEELGTNRSAFQCIQRYQTRLAPSLMMGKWSAEEDQFLKDMVESVTTGNHVPWQQVAVMMEGRSMEQCKERWTFISRDHKKGRWTTQEDLKLLSAVHCYGKKWVRVSEFVPGRTPNQCRERYLNSLDEELRYGNWTYEEDRELILLVSKFGEGKWTKIAKGLPGRTDNMVFQRHRRLMSWQKTNELLDSLPEDALKTLDNPNKKGCPIKNATEVKEKVGRLLEQRHSERLFRQQERHSDLTQLLPDTRRDDDGDSNEEPDDDIQEEEPDASTSSDKISEAEERRKKASEMLESLAKRTYSERQTNWEREQELIKQDLKDGIYVPRPPDTPATRKFPAFDKRKNINIMMMECVQDTLKTTVKGEPELVYNKLAAKLLELNMLKEDEQEELEMDRTVREMLENRDRRKQIEKKINTIEMRRRNQEIEEKLMKALDRPTLQPRPPGRPRKYLAKSDEGKRQSGRLKEVEDKICSLMLKTLNVDKIGALLVSHAVKATMSSNARADAGEPMEVENQETDGIVEPSGPNEASVQSSGQSLKSSKSPKGRKKVPKKKSNYALYRGCDEYNTSMVFSAPTDASCRRAIECFERVVATPPEGTLPLPKVYRRRLIGFAERLYDIPPLPPATAALNGFKSLLLNRRRLLRMANRYYAGGKHNEEQNSASNQSTKMEKPDILPSGLHSSDITPQMVKKLSIHFALKDIREAKRLLEQAEAKSKNPAKCFSKTIEEARSREEELKKRADNRYKLFLASRQSHDYALFKARFHSLFLWPAMLSTFTVKQAESTSSTEPNPEQKKKRSMPLTAGPRKRKKFVKRREEKGAKTVIKIEDEEEKEERLETS